MTGAKSKKHKEKPTFGKAGIIMLDHGVGYRTSGMEILGLNFRYWVSYKLDISSLCTLNYLLQIRMNLAR